jgi:hypothetical protein
MSYLPDSWQLGLGQGCQCRRWPEKRPVYSKIQL